MFIKKWNQLLSKSLLSILFFAVSFNAYPKDKEVVIDLKKINFDFDKSTIKKKYTKGLKNYADFLKKNPSITVRLEGNCDVRGTTEYNLALGQRRADAVQKFLTTLGVDKNRITTHSYGEEKLVCEGVTKACHAKNRRTDFVSDGVKYFNSLNLEVMAPVKLKLDEDYKHTRVGISYTRIFGGGNFAGTLGYFFGKDKEGFARVGLGLLAGSKKNVNVGFNVLMSQEDGSHLQPTLGVKLFLTDSLSLNVAGNAPAFKLSDSKTSFLWSTTAGLGFHF